MQNRFFGKFLTSLFLQPFVSYAVLLITVGDYPTPHSYQPMTQVHQEITFLLIVIAIVIVIMIFMLIVIVIVIMMFILIVIVIMMFILIVIVTMIII